MCGVLCRYLLFAKLLMFSYRLFAIIFCAAALLVSIRADAQRRHSKHKEVADSVQAATPEPIEIKPDRLVLRYKPQAGTLLYNVHTEIAQHVRTDQDELSGSLMSSAQLAFHN